MPDISKTERAYLAGLWDGEGSITLCKSIRKEKKNYKSRLNASIVFTNTNLEIIEWVEKRLAMIGATFHRYTVSVKNNPEKWKSRSKDCYRLTARNRESVERTLKMLIPFLIAKKEQAQIVLAFVRSRKEQMKKTKGRPSNTTPYTEQEFELERRVRKLNKYGKSEPPETKR